MLQVKIKFIIIIIHYYYYLLGLFSISLVS